MVQDHRREEVESGSRPGHYRCGPSWLAMEADLERYSAEGRAAVVAWSRRLQKVRWDIWEAEVGYSSWYLTVLVVQVRVET